MPGPCMRREFLILSELRDAAIAARDLVGDLSAPDINADPMRRAALLWQFTVVGEAATQIPDGIRDANPQIPWRAASRMRNRIVHGYWDIDVETLVATAADDLPAMIAELEALIGQFT